MKPCAESESFHVVDVLVPPADLLRWVEEAGTLEWKPGLAVRVVGKDHLVEMKRMRNGPVDQEDIRRLGGPP